MKKTILKKNIKLRKRFVGSGSSGELVLVQDIRGGHIATLPAGDYGFVDVALAPNAVTLVHWYKDDERTYWSSIKMTSDVAINKPSSIYNLIVEIVDTVSAKIKWNAPQGFSGDDNVSADLYYLVVSLTPLYEDGDYDAQKLNIIPVRPNQPQTYIIPNLSSGERYYVGLYSEKVSYGIARRSNISNIATFVTTALDGNAEIPKRIPLDANNITETFLHIAFDDGMRFINYPSFKRLAEQAHIIDNNGDPSASDAPPYAEVAAYQSYGTRQPSWYNVGSYKVVFKLDGVYDLDYLYMIQSNNNRFSIEVSGDGVNFFQAFDKQVTPLNMSGWTKVPLSLDVRNNVQFIQLSLYYGDGYINGFVPYGTRKTAKYISGEKYKKTALLKPVNDVFGTNAFLAEEQFEKIGKVSGLCRLYNETDWFMYGTFRSQGTGENATPDDIQMASKQSHMWDYDLKMQELLDTGQKNILFTLVAGFSYLRDADDQLVRAGSAKPIDPNLNYTDLAVTTNPMSYTHVARIAASMAYRWGFNENADDVCNQFVENDGLKGLGLVRYWEFANEMERHWGGATDFQKAATMANPQEMAAYLSAVFDGHKGAMGAGFGIRAADPNAKMVMPGLFSINYDFVKEMFLWWDLNRGAGDYPIDVINFHHYNTYTDETDTPTYSEIPAYALPPETGDLIHETQKMNRVRCLFAPNKELWITEFGYDEQYGGMGAPRDATKLLRGRHKAVWILRSLLIYQNLGLDAMCHYWFASYALRVEDVSNDNKQRPMFDTSALVDGTTNVYDKNRKPLIGWWYVTAFRNAMQGYVFSHSVVEQGVLKIAETDIIIDLNPDLWVLAFKHQSTQEHILIAWIGVEDWSSISVRFKVESTVTQLSVIDFYEQDSRLSEIGVTSLKPATIEGTSKVVTMAINETPVILKTEVVGTPMLHAPENIKVEGLTPSSIKIAWTDKNIGTNKARIYRSLSQDSGFSIIEEVYRDSAETVITGLAENTHYYFRVQFVKDNLISEVSETVDGVTLITIVPPSSLAKDDSTSSSVTLSWFYSALEEAKVQGFIISRSLTPNGEYLELASLAKDVRQYRDFGLVANTTYYYKVRAYKDNSISDYSFYETAVTKPAIYVPPTIQSATINSAGTSIELIFNEEMKDEQTAINAFTVMEVINGGAVVPHPVSAISIGADKTKVILTIDIPIFKNSVSTLGYSANIGSLKSVYNYAVNSFNSYIMTNNVAELYVPIVDWTEVTGITINRNNLSAVGAGRAVSKMKIAAGTVGIVQFSCEINDSMYLGLDSENDAEGYGSMDYCIQKDSDRVFYKKGNVSGASTQDFGKGIIRFRADGILIHFEVSYNNGLSFVEVTNAPQPLEDLYVKVYADGTSMKNIVGKGLVQDVVTIVPEPPTNITIDDETDYIGFTPNPNYPLSQHEFSTNYGSPSTNWATVSTNPINIGDVNIDIGKFGVRVKAGTGRAASAVLLNDVELTGTINADAKIMVQRSNGGTVLFTANALQDLVDWLATYTITQDINVQFNTSDTYLLDAIFAPTYNNGTNWVTFQGATGVRPVFDVQKQYSSVWRCEQDFTVLRNIELRNADIDASGGAIIRADSRNNMKFLDIIADFGYCVMRATTGVSNFEIDGFIVRNVRDGSFRINGENGLSDGNISIKNIKLDHSTGEGGNIAGTSYGFHAPLVLKYNNNWIVENVGSLNGDTLFDLGIIEESGNIQCKNLRGLLMYFQNDTELKLKNCYLPAIEGSYMNNVDGIEIIHSQLKLFIYLCANFRKVRGNILLGGLNGYLNAPIDIPTIEDNNLIVEDTAGYYIDFGFADSSPRFRVDASNLATYQLTKGGNTLFVSYSNRNTVNQNPFGSLRANSVGKGMITGTIEGVTDDVNSIPRTYPTDVGAFGGSRPDVNDQPAPPTITADNLSRTLIATHPLGESQILVSMNAGAFLPYSGLINVGDLALAIGYYEFKIKAAPYRDESVVALSPAFTDKPETGDYEVLRTMEINFRSDYTSDSPEININEYHDNATGDYDSLTIYLDLKDKTGASTGIRVANFERPWDGVSPSSAPAGDYIRLGSAIESGLSVTGSFGNPAKLKFSGLDVDKFYQFYIIGATDDGNNAARYTIGSVSVDKITSGNYPLSSNGNIYINPAVVRISDIVPNGSGEIIIEFQKIGTAYQQTVLNYMVIEETNEAKPA